MKYGQYIITVDFETEDLNLLTTRPWQLAYSVMQNKRVLEEYNHHILWEDLEISKDAARITRFDYQKYRSLAKPSRPIAEEFADKLYDSSFLIAGHNIIGFDLPVAQTWLKIEGLWRGWRDIPERVLDSMLLLRIDNNNYEPDKENLFASQLKEIGKPERGAKKSSLGAGCKMHNIDYSTELNHDALYDIQKTGELLNKLIYKFNL